MLKSCLAAVALLVGFAGSVQAQDYPNKLIRFIHGFPAGGNVDVIARLLANEMQKGLGQTIVVEAKPGQIGGLAAETVARSEPDGYTLLVVSSVHPAHGALARNIKYKVIDDFDWISLASSYPFVICVRKDSRFQTLQQVFDEARAKPGSVTYASAGVGSLLHTTAALLGNETKTVLTGVPYRGEAPAITGLLSGDVDLLAATSGSVGVRVRSGEFRALAVTSKQRWREFPDVPTVQETGIAGFEVISWAGLAGPKGMPKAVVDRLNAELRKAVGTPENKTRLENMGGDGRPTSPAEMRALVQSQLETWAKLGRDANISID